MRVSEVRAAAAAPPATAVTRDSRGFAGTAAVAVVALTVTRASGAIGGILTARLLGAADKGRFAVLFVIATLVGTLCAAGVDLWATRELGRGRSLAEVGRVVRRHVLLATAVVVVVGALAAPVAVVIGVSPAGWAATVGLAAATTWFLFTLAVPLGAGRMADYARANVMAAGLYVAAVAAVFAAGWASVAVVLLAAGVAKAVPVAVARHHQSGAGPATDVRADHRAALRLGVPASIGGLAELATYRVDVLVVAAIAGPLAVGLYTAAVALSEVLWLVPNAVSHVLVPAVAADSGTARTARVVRVSLIATAAAGAPLAVFGGPLIRLLFGDAFAGASGALPALVVAALFLAAWKLLTADLLGRGLSGVKAVSAGLGLLTMVALDVLLVPWAGVQGAALAAAGGYLVAAAVSARQWVRAGGTARDLVRFEVADLRAGAVLARRLVRR